MEKTKQLLYLIATKYPKASVTVLMKLAYLVDLIALKELGRKISEFEYKRYFYGPFDSKIYPQLDAMQADGLITAEMYFTLDTEYAVYSIAKPYETNQLSEEEKQLVEGSIKDFTGYGARALTEIAYRTEPMIKLGATLGGDENLNAQLELT